MEILDQEGIKVENNDRIAAQVGIINMDIWTYDPLASTAKKRFASSKETLLGSTTESRLTYSFQLMVNKSGEH